MPNVNCGAKTRAGGQCKAPAMPNGRCRIHGGASTGAPKGNQSALKHGFYSNALLDDDERELYGRAEIGSIDEEIKLAKVKLYRYVKASNSVELMELVDGALDVIRKQGEDIRGIPFDKSELKAIAPNYADLIIRTLDLVRKLELAATFMKAAPPPPGKEDASPVGKIIVEVVSARNKNGNDGAAG